MRKYPNASIFSVITEVKEECESIVFLYLKPIPDYFNNSDPFWYTKEGYNSVWNKNGLTLRERVVVGKDEDIINIYNNLLKNKKLNDSVSLDIPSFKAETEEKTKYYYQLLHIDNIYKIPHSFKQKEILDTLSGYKPLEEGTKAFFPLGIYESDFIYNNLQKEIFGVIEYRLPYLTFHGDRKTSITGKGSKDMIGFYQANFSDASDYRVVFKDDNNNEIGNCIIDKTNGIFKTELSDYFVSANIEIKKDSALERDYYYTLLQGINFSSEIVNSTYKDAYGREISIRSKTKKRPKSITPFTWQIENFSTSKSAYQTLSDKFKEIIDFLGPKVLIADPHYFDNLEMNEINDQYELRDRQKAFVNAFISSAIDKGLEKLIMLGSNKKVDIGKYEKLIRDIVSSNQIKRYFQPNTFIFKKSNQGFHNRYWFGFTENDGAIKFEKLVVLTNSIQGKIDEIDFIHINDKIQLNQIMSKYAMFNDYSINRLEI